MKPHVFVLLSIYLARLVHQSHAVCPQNCTCNNRGTEVDCSGRGLTFVPNLDPNVEVLKLAGNDIEKLGEWESEVSPMASFLRWDKLNRLLISTEFHHKLLYYKIICNSSIMIIYIEFKYSEWPRSTNAYCLGPSPHFFCIMRHSNMAQLYNRALAAYSWNKTCLRSSLIGICSICRYFQVMVAFLTWRIWQISISPEINLPPLLGKCFLGWAISAP